MGSKEHRRDDFLNLKFVGKARTRKMKAHTDKVCFANLSKTVALNSA